jgi:hypothetical protein
MAQHNSKSLHSVTSVPHHFFLHQFIPALHFGILSHSAKPRTEANDAEMLQPAVYHSSKPST